MDETAVALQFFDFIQTITILFLVIVAPLWIIFHYGAKRRHAAVLTDEEQMSLDKLSAIAERMERRLDTLEKILETDHPRWKENN